MSTTKCKTIILPSAVSSSKAERTRIKKTADERLFLTCSVVFTIGLLIGAIIHSFASSEIREYISAVCDIRLSSAASDKVYLTLISCVSQNMIFILAAYLFSYCAFGPGAIILLITARGIGCGTVIGYIYSLGLTDCSIAGGLLYAPAMALSVIALLLFSIRCIRATGKTNTAQKSSSARGEKGRLLHNFALACAVTFAASVVECAATILIAKLSA